MIDIIELGKKTTANHAQHREYTDHCSKCWSDLSLNEQGKKNDLVMREHRRIVNEGICNHDLNDYFYRTTCKHIEVRDHNDEGRSTKLHGYDIVCEICGKTFKKIRYDEKGKEI